MADVIARIKLQSGEFDSKIKRAAQGLLQMEQECRKVGGTLAVLEKDQLEFVKGLGKMETVSKNVRGKLGELTLAYTELSVQYKRLTEEEKRGDFGKALSSSLQQLKTRILETKSELNDVGKGLSGSKFGQFGSVIDTLGQKMGVTGNITEMLTSKTAMLTAGIGASVAIIGKATEAWVKYNDELAKQDQITTVTTGLKGDDADKMTDMARALVDTYNVDFRQAINAANTLMSQFGTTSEDTMQLLRDGMQGMIEGDGGKLLSMIQQYAPAFRDAGVSASQLIAVIQNSEGGIFTDQNMNAIVMGIKNIRLMTNATSEALAKLGIDGEEMTRKLNDGSMSIFDALKKVAQAVEGTSSSSQAAGEVMQQVFGRQGAMAGTKLGEAIASLNLNLEETKRQTGEVGESFAELQQANERLNKAIRDCFEYDGWEQMANGIKSKLYTALADVLEITLKIKDSWVGDLTNTIFDSIGVKAGLSLGPLGKVYTALAAIKALASGGSDENAAGAGASIGGAIASGARKSSGFLGDDDSGSHPGLIVKPTTKPTTTTTPRGGGRKSEALTYAETSISAQIKLVSELTKQYNDASASVKNGLLPTLVDAEKKLQQMKDETEYLKKYVYGEGSGKTYEQSPADRMKEKQEKFWKDFEEQNLKIITNWDKGVLDKLDKENKNNDDGLSGNLSKLSGKIGTLAGGLNSIASGFKAFGVEMPEEVDALIGVISGVSQIIGGVGTIIELFSTTVQTANTAALTANTVAMISLEAALWANTASGWFPFARGGIVHAAEGYVPGNNYSGDMVPALLNSGELVLNKAQQNEVAQELQGGNRMIQVHGVLRGKDIFIAAENWAKSVGKGEFVTW